MFLPLFLAVFFLEYFITFLASGSYTTMVCFKPLGSRYFFLLHYLRRCQIFMPSFVAVFVASLENFNGSDRLPQTFELALFFLFLC